MQQDNSSTDQPINQPEQDEIDSSQAEIDACWLEVKTRRKKVIWLFGEGKTEEALQMREQNKYMIEELNDLIKDFLLYKKYTDAVNKGKKTSGKLVPIGVSDKIKNQRTANGGIVQEVPKH